MQSTKYLVNVEDDFIFLFSLDPWFQASDVQPTFYLNAMASPSIDSLFPIIDGARIEGRLENVLQRKKEFQTLYTAI
jgi:hypothetical protein